MCYKTHHWFPFPSHWFMRIWSHMLECCNFAIHLNMAEKRKRAKVHGVVTRLSPVKTSKNTKRQYFDAAMTDGKKSVRMVSFLPSLRETRRQTQVTVDSLSGRLHHHQRQRGRHHLPQLEDASCTISKEVQRPCSLWYIFH